MDNLQVQCSYHEMAQNKETVKNVAQKSQQITSKQKLGVTVVPSICDQTLINGKSLIYGLPFSHDQHKSAKTNKKKLSKNELSTRVQKSNSKKSAPSAASLPKKTQISGESVVKSPSPVESEVKPSKSQNTNSSKTKEKSNKTSKYLFKSIKKSTRDVIQKNLKLNEKCEKKEHEKQLALKNSANNSTNNTINKNEKCEKKEHEKQLTLKNSANNSTNNTINKNEKCEKKEHEKQLTLKNSANNSTNNKINKKEEEKPSTSKNCKLSTKSNKNTKKRSKLPLQKVVKTTKSEETSDELTIDMNAYINTLKPINPHKCYDCNLQDNYFKTFKKNSNTVHRNHGKVIGPYLNDYNTNTEHLDSHYELENMRSKPMDKLLDAETLAKFIHYEESIPDTIVGENFSDYVTPSTSKAAKKLNNHANIKQVSPLRKIFKAYCKNAQVITKTGMDGLWHNTQIPNTDEGHKIFMELIADKNNTKDTNELYLPTEQEANSHNEPSIFGFTENIGNITPTNVNPFENKYLKLFRLGSESVKYPRTIGYQHIAVDKFPRSSYRPDVTCVEIATNNQPTNQNQPNNKKNKN